MELNKALESIDSHIWTSEKETGELLATLIRLSRYFNVLETGVFKGQTSCYMIDALKAVNGKYTGVDPEDHRNDIVRKYMENHTFIQQSSLEALKHLPKQSFDLIFIDSVHELDYLREEFKLAEQLIRQNGIIALHDCYLPGVKAWIDYLKTISWFEVISLDTLDNINYNRGVALVKCLYSHV